MSAASVETACLGCGATPLIDLVDFGSHAVCNHYLASQDAEVRLFPRELCQCPQCGLIQLRQRLPAAELHSPFDWIRYGEPEGHLDELAAAAIERTGLGGSHVIYGLSYKDASLLDRFKQRTGCRAVMLDPAADLDEPSTCAGMETIQERFDVARARRLRDRHGAARMIVVRHLMEHVQDLRRFSGAIRELLEPGGFLLVEQPDFSLPLEIHDYTTIWEERTAFYTPETLRRTLLNIGFEDPELKVYRYPLEHALVGLARCRDTVPAPASLSAAVLEAELKKGAAYSSAYHGVCERLRAFLVSRLGEGGGAAVFGAGHMASNFINLHGIQDLICFVVDDHPKKKGLFMPGTRLPIVGTPELASETVRLCFLTVRTEIEEKIIEANAAFTGHGGTFASILPGGPLSVHRFISAGA